MRRRRRIIRTIKSNRIVAWFLRLLWPHAPITPMNPAALRAERYQIVGFAVILLAMLVASTVVWFATSREGEARIESAYE